MMTREEYLALLKKSVAYNALSKEEKAKIAAAQGADMSYYAKVFLEETKTVGAAYASYVTQSQTTLTGFKGDVKEMQKDFLKKDEAAAVKADEAQQELLLKQISNL